jgi:segregation and condensation protein A
MENISGWIDLEGSLKVRLRVFEGPLDLLLHLIKGSKIDIYDIPMAEITSQYLEYLELMKDLNLDIASEFMIMAATLMHIKSRMLLPVHEEGGEEEDPRAELVQQLLEYQRYKEASQGLREMLQRRSLLFPRESGESAGSRDDVFIDVSLFELLKVFREVISTAQEGPGMVVAPDQYSVVDKMSLVMDLLGRRERLVFRDLFPAAAAKGEIVAAFLAILELVRLHMIHLSQREPGEELFLVATKG